MAVPVVFSTGSLHPFGLDRVYGWAAEAGYDGLEVMMDERWDTHQADYINHLAERHGIPVLALHPPLRQGAWRLDPEETLVRAARLARKIRASVIVAHPPSPGRPLQRWKKGPLAAARAHEGAGEPGVRVAVENMPKNQAKRAFSIRRDRSCYLPEHLYGMGDVTLDTSHVGASGVDLMQAYSKLVGQLRHVHLSDSDLSGGDQHRLPGKGKLPLKRFLTVLGEGGLPRRREPGAKAVAPRHPRSREDPRTDARRAGVHARGTGGARVEPGTSPAPSRRAATGVCAGVTLPPHSYRRAGNPYVLHTAFVA